MKHPIPLENQLRSLKPRQPSPGLEARLFGPKGTRFAAEASLRGWPWLVPSVATCSIALLLTCGNPAGLTSIGAESSAGMIATALSAFHSPHNAWPQRTFEWTNGSGSLTTAPSLSTNELPQ